MEQAKTLTKYFPSLKLEQRDVLPIVSIVTAISIAYVSCRIFSAAQDKSKNIKEIPVPGSSYPYVGHMMSLGDLPGRTIAKWHKELGPIIKLKMGVQHWIMIDDPVLAHKIFVTNGAITSNRPHNVFAQDHYSLGGKGISFAQPDSMGKMARAAAISILAPRHIERYKPSLERESVDLVTRFIESTEKDGSVDPFNHLTLFSMNVIATTLFSKRFDSVHDPDFISLASIIEQAMKNLGLENDLPNFLPIISLYDYFFGTQAEQKDFIKNKRNPFFRKLIHDATTAKGPNAIKSFSEDGFILSSDDMLAITSDLVIAGTDTISVSLLWNIAIMCHHPDAQKKVIEEIDNFIDSNERLPTFRERKQLPYCISVMKETMRLKSTTPFGIAHSTHEDCYIDDYFIPKGSNLISSMDSMHMRPDIYPEPEKFKPERFLNNLKTMQSAANGKLEERDHYNFGWGRRICPGIYLAENEMFLAFVQLFARCYIEPTSDGLPNINSAINAGITTLPVSYKVKFIKRTDSLI